jgi:hypothetical protein
MLVRGVASGSRSGPKTRVTARTLVTPLLQSALAHDSSSTLRAVLVRHVGAQLRQASLRRYAEQLWAETAYVSHSDALLLKEPNLHFVIWLTDALIASERDSGVTAAVRMCVVLQHVVVLLCECRLCSRGLRAHQSVCVVRWCWR